MAKAKASNGTRAKKNTAQNEDPVSQAEQADNIDKIRDIIFGSQMRDYQHRFTRLEELMKKEMKSLQEDMKRRLDALEAYTQKEIQAVVKQVKAEREERAASGDSLAGDLKSARAALEDRLGRMRDEQDESNRALQQQLLDQSKTLSDALQAKSADIMETLEQAMAELRDGKTDRTALAGMFTEMAMRLNEEFSLPDGE